MVRVAHIRAALAASLLAAAPSAAQQPTGGTIAGTVRDSTSQPVADAEVIARPSQQRVRTDSAGRFVLSGLDDGKYTVVARKLGYAPVSWDVRLSKSGRADVALVLDRRVPILDTVVVAAKGECSQRSFDGFACRRRGGGGVFMDYVEIDDKEPIYTADLFRDLAGFSTDLRSTARGPVRVVARRPPWGCMTSLVNGSPVSFAEAIPEYPWDLLGVEVYSHPDSVPKEYQQYTWPQNGGSVVRSGRCSVVVYWTIRARMSPKK